MHLPLSLYNVLTMSKFTLSAPPIKPFVFGVFETSNPYDRFVLRRDGYVPDPPEAETKVTEFTVTFRQGTFGEDKQRSELLWSRKRVFERGTETSTEITKLTPQTLVENDIYICICGIDGLEVEGISVPEFVQAVSYKKVKDKDKFLEFLARLPSQWVDMFYAAVLEVNPKWDLKS